MAHNVRPWNVLLFSCNPVGQLCLSGSGYSSWSVDKAKVVCQTQELFEQFLGIVVAIIGIQFKHMN